VLTGNCQCNSSPSHSRNALQQYASEALASVADALEPLLQKYFEAKRSNIRKSEAGESEFFANELKNAISSLERAQSSWKYYRDAHCEMVAELYLNGSGRAAAEAQCIIDLTRLRIRELAVYGSGLPEPN
jgi:Lysozyme inhibitor LprI